MDPFESIISETWNGPKKDSFASARIFSPTRMSAPPMNTAVFFRSFGPRVKIAP